MAEVDLDGNMEEMLKKERQHTAEMKREVAALERGVPRTRSTSPRPATLNGPHGVRGGSYSISGGYPVTVEVVSGLARPPSMYFQPGAATAYPTAPGLPVQMGSSVQMGSFTVPPPLASGLPPLAPMPGAPLPGTGPAAQLSVTGAADWPLSVERSLPPAPPTLGYHVTTPFSYAADPLRTDARPPPAWPRGMPGNLFGTVRSGDWNLPTGLVRSASTPVFTL